MRDDARMRRRQPFRRRPAGVLWTGVVASVLVVMGASPASANTIAIGPQAMEGNLQVRPGDVVRAGISFTVPGSHPAASVQFVHPVVSFADVVCVSGSGGGSFSIALGSGDILGPFAVPQNDPGWFPTGDQSSSAAYQGSIQVPDLCGGGTMSLRNGGAFSADAQSSDTSHTMNVRFHYAANGSSGSWSATKSVLPDAIGTTPVPVGTTGLLGLSLVVAMAFALARQRRARLATARLARPTSTMR